MTKALIGAVGAALVSVATFVAPPANAANPIGNFDLIISGQVRLPHLGVVGHAMRRRCITARVHSHVRDRQADCEGVQLRRRCSPRRRPLHPHPYGLRCGDVYYGPTSMTHDVYSWDATTMAGTLVSSFDAGCDGAPGTLTYPISQHGCDK